ncbi:MAG: ABC transporter permease [Chloroflexi bacterium]|nr:ABC transporter permease [Chloroflexota bacterium]
MNPLSPITYYLRHKGSALLLLSLITITTMLVYVMIAVVDSTSLINAEVSYLKHVSIVISTEGTFEPGVISQIQLDENTERVIPENGRAIRQPTWPIAYRVMLLGIPEQDMSYLITHYEMRLKDGRLPAPRTNEFVLTEQVARSIGLELGDQIDESINLKLFSGIQEPMVLVGILKADPDTATGLNARVGFASYEYFDSHELYTPGIDRGMLVVPKKGHQAALNQFLETEISSPEQTWIDTYEREVELWSTDRAGLLAAFGFINVVVAFGAAIIVGVVNQINVTQRLSELGMLNALGHHKKRLIRRLSLETAVMSGLSWLAGIGVSFGILLWLKNGFYYDKGMELDLWNPSPFWFVLPVPLIVISMSTIRIIRVLNQFDPVSIIERGKLSTEAQFLQGKQKTLAGSGAISAFTFYLRHRRRGITILVSTALAILIITLPTFVATATLDAVKPSMAYLQYVSQVLSYRSSTVDPGVMAQIRSNPLVERVIPIRNSSIEMAIPLGDIGYADVYGIREQDMPYLMNLFGVELFEGRLPQARSNELVITKAIAANHGFQVGDTIGIPYWVHGSFYATEPTDMVIVGIMNSQIDPVETSDILSKNMWLGFASYEFMENYEEAFVQIENFFIAPVDGQKAELDVWLEENIASPQTHVITYGTQISELEEDMRLRTATMTGIEISVVVIAGIAMATMNYVSFTQRREEFGVLNALGRSRRWLVLRAVRETTSIVGIAWLIGAGVYGLFLLVVHFTVFAPKGIALNIFDPLPWLFTFPIPLAVILASAGTVAWVLSRLDPITVVERRA